MVLPLAKPECTVGAVFIWRGKAFKARKRAQFDQKAGEMTLFIDPTKKPGLQQEADDEWLKGLCKVYARKFLEKLKVKEACCTGVEMHVDAKPPRIIFCFE